MKSESSIRLALKSAQNKLAVAEEDLPNDWYDEGDVRCYVENIARIEGKIESYEWVLEQ
tara:strand:- start:184 stop:360 length:177 start_codon:yes stop_codon:yes gene_type:complete